jgi:hypothetical protein
MLISTVSILEIIILEIYFYFLIKTHSGQNGTILSAIGPNRAQNRATQEILAKCSAMFSQNCAELFQKSSLATGPRFVLPRRTHDVVTGYTLYATAN